MPYGMKRGVKAPGEYGITDISGLALAGATGIIAALVTDYQQQGEASALYTINQWVAAVGNILGFGNLPLWVVVVGLIALGAGSIFYFQPITRQGAFAQGFGLLAVIMTATPSDLAGALVEANGGNLRELQPISYTQTNGAKTANTALTSGGITQQAEIVQVQDTRAARYEVQIQIDFPEGLPDDVNSMIRRKILRGKLHNEQSGETYNLFRTAGQDLAVRGNSIIIRAGVPARADTSKLWVRIEANDYAIEEQSATATLGNTLNWTITMKPSTTPLWIQRLNNSYWF